jgi:hypothetical protein
MDVHAVLILLRRRLLAAAGEHVNLDPALRHRL